ncbi:hypothetical protein MLD38_020780 [Melastoma candidum]|uniref:Uncharacterized protein n=1 Tax=Melastoma candidum TaxID=119954 RepID=A0ACB9QE85_9MYRT|nr:hypothetical protein MLD38_020780 [Melastoma candidum]
MLTERLHCPPFYLQLKEFLLDQLDAYEVKIGDRVSREAGIPTDGRGGGATSQGEWFCTPGRERRKQKKCRRDVARVVLHNPTRKRKGVTLFLLPSQSIPHPNPNPDPTPPLRKTEDRVIEDHGLLDSVLWGRLDLSASMASDKRVDVSNNQGGDWEVVSLTASTYTASPCPKEVDSIDEDNDTSQDEGHAESSDILLMSKHFAYPPSSQDQKGQVGDAKESKFWDKEEKDWTFKGLNFSDEFPGTEFLHSKDKGFPFEGGDFGDAKDAQEFDPVGKEQNLYTAATSSLHAEAALGAPTFFAKCKITYDDEAMHDTGPLCAPSDPWHSSEPNEDVTHRLGDSWKPLAERKMASFAAQVALKHRHVTLLIPQSDHRRTRASGVNVHGCGDY